VSKGKKSYYVVSALNVKTALFERTATSFAETNTTGHLLAHEDRHPAPRHSRAKKTARKPCSYQTLFLGSFSN
jgi:hypothetical protein